MEENNVVAETPVAETPTVEQPKKSKLPIILLVLVLLIGVGVGGYFVGKKLTNKTETKEEKKEESKPEAVPKGTDTNTSGYNIAETKTKNITLNGQEYELKIEILEGKLDPKFVPEGEDDTEYHENVYINGYKFISDQKIINGGSYYSQLKDKKRIFEGIEYQLENAKVLKDTNNNDSYLVFTDSGRSMTNIFTYILNAKGELIAKILNNSSMFGLNIATNNKPSKESNYTECNDEISCEAKYYLYNNGLTNIQDDYILFIPIQNANETLIAMEKEKNSNNAEVVENKLTISNGKVNIEKANIFKESDGYIFVVGGIGYYGKYTDDTFPEGIVQPAK